MSDTPQPNSDASLSPTSTLTPQRCLFGAVTAGAIAVVLYFLTSAIATLFATKGVHSDNLLVQRISAAVRTMLIGMSALGTGIFGLSAVGLFGLGIQLFVRRSKPE